MAKQIFYWSVDFEDGFNISQFDNNGKEVFIKDICGDDCWYIQDNGTKALDWNSNFFGKLEKTHGVVRKVAWKPFTKELYEKIEKIQPDIQVVLFNKVANEIYQNIPKNQYATIKKSIKVDYGMTNMGPETRAYMSAVTIGRLPRKKSPWNFMFNRGKITEYRIVLVNGL